MLTIILVGALFIGAFALVLISLGNARITRHTRALKRPVGQVRCDSEMRLIPRGATPTAR